MLVKEVLGSVRKDSSVLKCSYLDNKACTERVLWLPSWFYVTERSYGDIGVFFSNDPVEKSSIKEKLGCGQAAFPTGHPVQDAQYVPYLPFKISNRVLFPHHRKKEENILVF